MRKKIALLFALVFCVSGMADPSSALQQKDYRPTGQDGAEIRISAGTSIVEEEEGNDTQRVPVMDGSTATLPLMAALYAQLAGLPVEDAETYVQASGTNRAWNGLLEGENDILFVYERPEGFTLQQERELEILPVGRDALVFLTHTDNPVYSLTQDELQGIYSGEITNWKKVGGSNTDITAFQRNSSSGSHTLLLKLLIDRSDLMEAPYDWVIFEMGGLMYQVASYENTASAIGYSVYYFASEMNAQPELKLLAVDGVEPSAQSIADGSYPLVNDFYVAIRADEPPGSPARALRDWVLGEEGAALLEELGYVSARQAEAGPRTRLYRLESGNSVKILDGEGKVVMEGEDALAIHDAVTGEASYIALLRSGMAEEVYEEYTYPYRTWESALYSTDGTLLRGWSEGRYLENSWNGAVVLRGEGRLFDPVSGNTYLQEISYPGYSSDALEEYSLFYMEDGTQCLVHEETLAVIKIPAGQDDKIEYGGRYAVANDQQGGYAVWLLAKTPSLLMEGEGEARYVDGYFVINDRTLVDANGSILAQSDWQITNVHGDCVVYRDGEQMGLLPLGGSAGSRATQIYDSIVPVEKQDGTLCFAAFTGSTGYFLDSNGAILAKQSFASFQGSGTLQQLAAGLYWLPDLEGGWLLDDRLRLLVYMEQGWPATWRMNSGDGNLFVFGHGTVRDTYAVYEKNGTLVTDALTSVNVAGDRMIVRRGFNRGLMDASGNWLYQESVFDTLED